MSRYVLYRMVVVMTLDILSLSSKKGKGYIEKDVINSNYKGLFNKYCFST